MGILLQGNTLVLTEDFNVKQFSEFKKLLSSEHQTITKLDIRCDLNVATLYLFKKYFGEQLIGLPEKYTKQFESITVEVPEYNPVQIKYDTLSAYQKSAEIFDLGENNAQQNNFWLDIFGKTFLQLTLDNAFIIFIIFVGIGITLTYVSYSTLFDYGVELESAKVAMGFGLKIFCPMMSVILVTAKSCTAISSIIKSMSINGDFKVMHIMNLPYKRVYLHPMFVACAICGPLVNLVAILGTLVGSCISWHAKGHAIQLFFSILNTEFYTKYIVNSEIRAFLASFLTGFCMCVAGLMPGKDFQSLIYVINTCITLSFIANILAQTIVSLF